MNRIRDKLSAVSALCLLSAALGGTAHSQTVEIPAGFSQCDFDAWVPFASSTAVPVRSAPSEAAPILGYLPNGGEASGDERYAVEFHVSEARPGWLHIRDALDREGSDVHGNELPPRQLPAREGWIAANMAEVGVQSSLGYARPDASSPRVLDLKGGWLTEPGRITAIRACSGAWLLLDFILEPSDIFPDIPRQTGTAWFRGICSISETTCDHASVDDLP